jgi:hypothetical protein
MKPPSPAKTTYRAVVVPVAAAPVVGLIGLLRMALGVPWLFPSLGPTIAIQLGSPDLPGARAWNVVAGHLIGLCCGIAAVYLTGAAGTPGVTEAQALSDLRVGAAVVAVLLSMWLQAALRASDPPAEATTLLIALGALKPDLRTASMVLAGVILIALQGEISRRLVKRSGG